MRKIEAATSQIAASLSLVRCHRQVARLPFSSRTIHDDTRRFLLSTTADTRSFYRAMRHTRYVVLNTAGMIPTRRFRSVYVAHVAFIRETAAVGKDVLDQSGQHSQTLVFQIP